MDPLTIAGLVASIGGAALQYDAQREANQRMQAETRRALENQRRLQMQAEQKAMDTAKKFETPKRAEQQQQIADQITETLMQPVSESQAIRAEQQTTQGDVSGDYLRAKAASDLETVKSAQTLARLLGKTTSASRLRMGEGIRMMDTGIAIDQLNNFSRGQDKVDDFAIEQASKLDPTKVFLGTTLRGVGSVAMSAPGYDLNAAGAGLKYGAGGQQAAMLAAQEAGMGTGGLWNQAAGFRDGFNNFMRGFQ